MSIQAARAICDSLGEGCSVVFQGAAGESRTFCDFVAAGSGLRKPFLFSSLVPGLNSFDYTAHIEDGRLATLLLPAALRPGFQAGRVTVWPVSYYHAGHHVAGGSGFDLVVAHACPPDKDGQCALGVTADFIPLVWKGARRRIIIVNDAMPRIRGAATVPAREADVILEGGGAPMTIPPPGGDAATDRIAALVAEMIRDGDAIQFGIGAVPDVTMGKLRHRRDQLVHSGSEGDGLIAQVEGGALRPGRVHRTGALVGSSALHRFAADNDILTMVDTLHTHAPTLFPVLPRFVSVNSALEVDLFGQVNLEWRAGQLVSGVGGAPDFIAGAHLSPGGRSIIALPATAAKGTISRIVARLDTPTVSIPRNAVDTIVTEHGVAHLEGSPMDARAQALIAIAAPEFRDGLEESWRTLRAKL
jgi:acyl-CoA hydrolase